MLGGSFDPVHNGHLNLARGVRDALHTERLLLVPAARSPHKPPPLATDRDRLDMLKAAIAGEPGLHIDTRELGRAGPSYTVDTLQELRAEYPRHALGLILGGDAFAGLERWHRWQRLTELCHVLLIPRPGVRITQDAGLGAWARRARVADPAKLRKRPAGYMLELRLPLLDISSSGIRQRVRDGQAIRAWVPGGVDTIITKRKLYVAER